MNVKPTKNLINLVRDLICFGGWSCGVHSFHTSMFSLLVGFVLFFPDPASAPSLSGIRRVRMCVSVEYKAVANLRFIIVFAVACSVINTISCRRNV